jgi:hypothetical protein
MLAGGTGDALLVINSREHYIKKQLGTLQHFWGESSAKQFGALEHRGKLYSLSHFFLGGGFFF